MDKYIGYGDFDFAAWQAKEDAFQASVLRNLEFPESSTALGKRLFGEGRDPTDDDE